MDVVDGAAGERIMCESERSACRRECASVLRACATIVGVRSLRGMGELRVMQ